MNGPELEARIVSLYGRVDWAAATGVLHVAAIEAERHCVIALGPAAPASETDRFVLGFARARSDVLVTTGQILRSEPSLVHRYAEDPRVDAAFAGWRRRVLGRTDPPALVVLSRSGRFPHDHPALEAAHGGFVWTTPRGRERLPRALAALEVVVGEEDDCEEDGRAAGRRDDRGDARADDARESEAGAGGVRAAIAQALAEAGRETVLIEAGPSTASALYAASAARSGVDELLLSRFEGRLDPQAEGPPFVSTAAIARQLGAAVTQHAVDAPSGRWRFERYRPAGGRSIVHKAGPSGT